ncbi:MAG: translocation/assembly module TamB [Muribaculaceae bacterium]|nr:translocation/assembly module TamB [Muribaculaceae bacterium]
MLVQNHGLKNVNMKIVLYNIYRVVRTLIVLGIATMTTVFVSLYLILLIPSVQSSVKDYAEEELTVLLNTKVDIERLSISPFNQVVLYGVEIPDNKGNAILKVDKLGAGLSLYNLILRKRIVFTYAEIVGLKGSIYRDTQDSPLNVQFIIDALSPKDKNKPPTKFDLAIYNIVMRRCSVSYDVLCEDFVHDKFDKNHIRIEDLRADIALPLLRNNDFSAKVKRLSFKEKSGLCFDNLTMNARITEQEIGVSDFRLELPGTHLRTNDFTLSFNSLKTLGSDLRDIKFDIGIIEGSYLTLNDLSCFIPAFSKYGERLNMAVKCRGTLENIKIPECEILAENGGLAVDIKGEMSNVTNKDSLTIEFPRLFVNAKSSEISKLVSCVGSIKPQTTEILLSCGGVRIEGFAEGNNSKMLFQGKVNTGIGDLLIDGNFLRGKTSIGFNGNMSSSSFNLGTLLNKPELLGETAFSLKLDGTKSNSGIKASVNGNVPFFDFKSYRYENISANVEINPSEYSGNIHINDKNLALAINGTALLNGDNSHVNAVLAVNDFNLAKTNLSAKHPNHRMSFYMKAETTGNQADNWNGNILVENFKYVDAKNEGIKLDSLVMVADNTHTPYSITLASDVLNGKVDGIYDLKGIIPTLTDMLSHIFPALVESTDNSLTTWAKNDFTYSLNVENNEKTNDILNFFKSPVTLLYPVSLHGAVNQSAGTFNFDLNAPYLAQKKKLIENSRLSVALDSINHRLTMNLQTTMPTKKGKMSLAVSGDGCNNRLDTDISWKVDRQEDFHGNVNLSLGLGRVKETGMLMATVDINPTTMVFNDTTWYVHGSKAGYYNKALRVDDFRVTCDNQFVRINGRTSPGSNEKLEVELKDINLGYVFETLQINNVTFGGIATGKVIASDLISASPLLETERFFVDDMTYNETLLGDADIKSFWNNEKKFVAIKAQIKQNNGCESTVDGEIYPMNDSMRFDFNTEKLKVGFMKPFMSAITSDLDGYVSGDARLYGKFSTLNMYGNVFVEDLKVKVDYTNVYYWATDSIKIAPGLITFNDVRLKDRKGKRAMLSGYVSHQDFHNAAFEFNVTDARELLCYDIPEKREDAWYGTIYGSGSAFINGEPGFVGIDVRMTTAAGSKFFFELSDAEEAIEYDFITFTDKRRDSIEAEILAKQTQKELLIKNFEQQKKKSNDSSGTRMKINIDADINPLGQMILVMDPVGGDMIKATGNGSLIMKYDTAEDLFMSGKYTLDKGTYNFTLQDIIVKDFTIKEGSNIAFDGNPYAAKIDISAVYSLNASLLDLDESFATDKEFNRTNVPVHALLNVSGSIAQPEIKFDLEFPTLTSDAHRKVKSIVSTDDMMNRQIIYLLALNRFYTPEYMGGTSRNNELASVASSTISSQLTSMLGQISDKWRISPNFKSDKGDFSDVEVNLALSSQLLNNRLLLNGNFGYRDKMVAANNSNFIGDFDIEYLLNKAGNVRLKAYNHFNDQNYYVKNALTTQGVGVVFKFDFDNPFGHIKNRKSAKQKPVISNELPADTIK